MDGSFHGSRHRNRLFAVQHLVERQGVERHSGGTADVNGFAAEGDRAVVQVFPLRGGKMVDRHSFHLENVAGQDMTTVLESFGLEYYGSAPSVPPQIVVPREAGDLSALAELLSEKRGARVEVTVLTKADYDAMIKHREEEKIRAEGKKEGLTGAMMNMVEGFMGMFLEVGEHDVILQIADPAEKVIDIDLLDVYPAGLVNAALPNASTTCANGVVAMASVSK